MQQRLLVVEDDPGVRTTIVTCLELEGYAVDSASSTKEAIDRLAAASYPIVISDIYIDDRTGLDVLEAARRKDPGCSVILMTARGTMETWIALPSRPPCLRVSCSATCEAHSPAPTRTASASSKRLTKAPCFWMRSARLPSTFS